MFDSAAPASREKELTADAEKHPRGSYIASTVQLYSESANEEGSNSRLRTTAPSSPNSQGTGYAKSQYGLLTVRVLFWFLVQA